MALPAHAVVAYRYRLVGGVYDGLEQVLQNDVPEISVPGVPPEFVLNPQDAQANIKSHGHVFPKGTKFHRYITTGQVVKCHMVMEFVGYADNITGPHDG